MHAITLADPQFYEPVHINVLIGTDDCGELLPDGLISGGTKNSFWLGINWPNSNIKSFLGGDQKIIVPDGDLSTTPFPTGPNSVQNS